jgi:hypothetical protein
MSVTLLSTIRALMISRSSMEFFIPGEMSKPNTQCYCVQRRTGLFFNR